MEDSLDQAFEIVAGVEDYLSKNVLPKARKNSHHNCDSLFQEAESLLLKGLPKVNVLDKLCKETLAKYPPLLFSSQADVESEGENVIPEYSVDINESSIPVDNVNSTDETEKNESQSPALPSCHILSEPKNKQRKMQDEDPASKTNSKSKDGNTDVSEPQPSCSGYKKQVSAVPEVTIESDDDSVGSVECLNCQKSVASNKDVIVVDDTSENVEDEVQVVNTKDVPDVVTLLNEATQKLPCKHSRKCSHRNCCSSNSELRDDEIHEEAEELLQHLPFSTYDAVSSAVKNWYHDSNRKYAVMSILIAEAAFKGKEIPQSTYKALKNLAPKKRDLTHVEDVEEQPGKRKTSSMTRPETTESKDAYFESPESPQHSGFSITIDNRPSHLNPHVFLDPLNIYNEMKYGDVMNPLLSGDGASHTGMQWPSGTTVKSETSEVPYGKSFPSKSNVHEMLFKDADLKETHDEYALTNVPKCTKLREFRQRTCSGSTMLSSHDEPTNAPEIISQDFGVEERVLFKEENIDMEEDAPPEVPANIDEIHPEDIGADEEQVTVEDPQLNDGAAGVLDDVQRQNWIEEKTALVASIIETVPVCTIAERVRLCFSDVDIEQVIDSLLNSASPAPEVNAADRVQRDEAVAGPSGWSAFRTVKNGDRASAASTSTEGSMPGLKEFIPSRPGGALHLSDDEVTSSVDEAGPSTSGSNKEAASHDDEQEDEEWVESHSRTLREMFPDADPEYLATRCEEVKPEVARFEALAVELMETKNYPKMEEYLARKKRREMRKKFLDGMTVPEFLELFEEPEKVFYDSSKKMSAEYRNNSRAQLLNDLPFHLSKEVDHVLNANNYHYLPSLRQLKLYEKCGRRKTKRKETPISGELEDFFLKELCYARLEESIERHRAAQEEAKKEAFAAAKVAGLLCTCPICCEDEILEEDMRACASLDSPHLFCKTCVRRYCEEQIGQGSLKFTCLEGSCKEEFSLNVLKTVLKSSVFSNLLKRKQAEEIVAAGIADLECCPFCNFATIMPNKEDKIFNCLNPECLKDTCRLCKELSHIPLRCEEVETKSQLSARTYLENQMSEAMVRECYKCGQRFIKEDGCNKMVCSCGAVMCYLCKKPIRGYDHFTDQGRAAAGGLTPSENGKCALWSNSLKLHAEEVQKRAAEAKKTLDPDVQLKHDPTKDVPQVPDFLQNPHPYVVVPPPQRAHRPPDAPVNIVARPLRAGNAFQLGVEGRRHMHEPFGPWGPHYNLIADDAAVFGDLLGRAAPEPMILQPQPAHLYHFHPPFVRNPVEPHRPVAAGRNPPPPPAHGARDPPPPPPPPAHAGRHPPPAHGGAGAAAMAAGNWLQVQVNLDHRNLHNPRVEVQAGGGGNNHWEIQYNVLPRRAPQPVNELPARQPPPAEAFAPDVFRRMPPIPTAFHPMNNLAREAAGRPARVHRPYAAVVPPPMPLDQLDGDARQYLFGDLVNDNNLEGHAVVYEPNNALARPERPNRAAEERANEDGNGEAAFRRLLRELDHPENDIMDMF
ncbi:uncharacterized protein LOC108678287 isoform X2 [Hyalella azteca]|uniref:Uncharacterized protein LOC108678287 isoform X2 n=1 Tax=Hyalella azteca TaxID=294128 RepID=A0A8B7P8L7_HYAAZ|nr:uncharacterized protein LOC108678287 isoform X2 [Hyalella azteca]